MDKLDRSTVPKKFVDKLSLPPFTWGTNLLGKNKKMSRFIEQEKGKDGLLMSIVYSKLKRNGFSFFYNVLRK